MENLLRRINMQALELTATFSFLFGTILVLLFSADKAKTKNIYLKKAK